MLGIGLVNMLVALDQTVVSTALPSIVAELHGFEYYAWIASAYLLASVVTVPVFGRLGDYFGRKRFVIAAVVTFTVASVLCGLATNMLFLVFARGLQGVGGGMMVGTAFAAIPDLFPDPRARVRWQVVMAAAYGIGTAAGPSLGGWMSQHWGWRSTFLVNLPVGAAAFYFIWAHLPNFHRPRQGEVRIDWLGAALVALVLGGLQAFIEAVPKDGLTTGNLVLAACVLAARGGASGLREARDASDHPARHLQGPAARDAFHAVVPGGLRDVFADLFRAAAAARRLRPVAAGGRAARDADRRFHRARQPDQHAHRDSSAEADADPVDRLHAAAVRVDRAGVRADLDAARLDRIPMAGIGIGLGFILNNLNVFGQEIAGRERFGITTALLQSTRMVGGMLGTSIVATIVAHHYRSVVARTISVIGEPAASTWLPRFADPRILIDEGLRERLIGDLRPAGLDAQALIDAARDALVQSIHIGVMLTAVAALAAALMVRRISHITFRRAGTVPAPAK